MTMPAAPMTAASRTPSSKVTVGALAGALTFILISEVNRHFPGAAIPGDEGSAITVVITFLCSYFTPHAQA